MALVLRLIYIFFLPQEKIHDDAIEYETLAGNILAGRGYVDMNGIPESGRPPLYPFFLAGIYRLFGYSNMATRIIQAFLDSLTCLFIYFIGKEIFNVTIGKVAAFITVFHPILIAYTGLILSETLYTLLLVITIYYLAKGLNRKVLRYYILGGLFLGLANLCRPITLYFPVLILIGMLLIYDHKRKAILHLLSLSFIMLAVITPWSIRNYIQFKTFTPVSSYGGINLWCGTCILEYDYEVTTSREPLKSMLKKYSLVELNQILGKKAIATIKEHPIKYVIISLIKRFPKFWLTSHSAVLGIDKPNLEYWRNKKYLLLFIKSILLLLEVGLFLLSWVGIIGYRRYWRQWLILVLVFVFFSIHLLLVALGRYQVPILPLLNITAGAGLVFLKEKDFVRNMWRL